MTRTPEDGGRTGTGRGPRRVLALLASAIVAAPLLLLATCAAPVEPQLRAGPLLSFNPGATAVGPARLTDDAIIAGDGARLPLRKWLPSGPVKAVVLALHGFGDYSNGFDAPARQWAARGIATYAYDQRGFGAAPGRGLWPGEGRLALDAIVATRLLRAAYPGKPLYLLGESMGGAVAIVAASGAMQGVVPEAGRLPHADVDGVILSAPAVWGRETMDLLPKLALFAAVRLFPGKVLTGSGLRILASDNIPMLRALARDPLVLKGARVDTLYGTVDLMDDALAAAPRLKVPTQLLYGAHDEVVPPSPMREFVSRLPSEPRRPTLAFYRRGYHLLLRDLEGPVVAEDVAGWILNRDAALPSRADAAGGERPWPPAATIRAACDLACASLHEALSTRRSDADP